MMLTVMKARPAELAGDVPATMAPGRKTARSRETRRRSVEPVIFLCEIDATQFQRAPLQRQEPGCDRQDEELGPAQVGKQPQRNRAGRGVRVELDVDKGEAEEKPQVCQQRRAEGEQRLLARKPRPQVEDQDVRGREKQQVRAIEQMMAD